MAAATFHTYSPPAPPGEAGYPAYLPVTIVGVAVSVCIVSNLVLAHSAITARNKMAEMILTKRRLWWIMAEKEAAEQANELKQQFISVASHEVRPAVHQGEVPGMLTCAEDPDAVAHCEWILRADFEDVALGGAIPVCLEHPTGMSCHQRHRRERPWSVRLYSPVSRAYACFLVDFSKVCCLATSCTYPLILWPLA